MAGRPTNIFAYLSEDFDPAAAPEKKTEIKADTKRPASGGQQGQRKGADGRPASGRGGRNNRGGRGGAARTPRFDDTPIAREGDGPKREDHSRQGPRPGRGGRGPRSGDDNRPRKDSFDKDGKRFYDRRSGSGRGREVAKDGAGKYNWGSNEQEAANETNEPKMENGETEEELAARLAEEAAEAERAAKEMTLEEYSKNKQSLDMPKPNIRKADEGTDNKWADMVELEDKNEEDFHAGKQIERKDKKKEQRATTKNLANDLLNVRLSDPVKADGPSRNDDRGARGARSGGRGGRGGRNSSGSRGGRGSGANINVNDNSAFPTLGGK